MSIMHMPFYIKWATYMNFIEHNFIDTQFTVDTLFIGYIILNIAYIFLIIQLLKFIYTLCIYIKNFFR